MTICAICCFCGRHKDVKRILRYYLDQDYKGQSYLLLYNNSPGKGAQVVLDNIETPDNKAIILINNNKDLQTGKEYTNTGDIFRDALTFVPLDVSVVTHFDSDDAFLPNHLSAGAEGMKKAKNLGCLAYKPYNSYFLYENKCKLLHNTLEPSIFVNYFHLQQEGYYPKAVTYHQKWLDVLVKRKQLFVDMEGKPTLLYNWSEGHGNHKISGGSDDDINFEAHRKWETSYSPTGILSPSSELEAQYFYRIAQQTK